MMVVPCDSHAILFKNNALATRSSRRVFLARDLLSLVRLLSNGWCWSMMRASRLSELPLSLADFCNSWNDDEVWQILDGYSLIPLLSRN
jgi:hypothetical protein